MSLVDREQEERINGKIAWTDGVQGDKREKKWEKIWRFGKMKKKKKDKNNGWDE